ncbi:MAG: hypothetical protein Q8N53_23660, partial [Longimicrobiales bacterium]|nr:hypothetical protein [Longimicrobiales bacterium]
LEDSGIGMYRVSARSTWDEAEAGSSATAAAPAAFLSQMPEQSQEALLVYGLAFWLAPGELVAIARRSYLVLGSGGTVLFAVPSFAWSAPAPAWCAPQVVEKALELAGFSDIQVNIGRAADKWPAPFTVSGRKA